MGDRFPAYITIGGKLAADKFDDLISAITNEGAACESYGGDTDETSVREYIEAQIKAAGTIEFYDAEANYGNFNSLEEFCREAKLHYCRHSDGYSEFDAEFEWWHPGMTVPVSALATNGGDSVVLVSQLEELMMNGPNDAEGYLASVLEEFIKKAKPPEVPPFELLPASVPTV